MLHLSVTVTFFRINEHSAPVSNKYFNQIPEMGHMGQHINTVTRTKDNFFYHIFWSFTPTKLNTVSSPITKSATFFSFNSGRSSGLRNKLIMATHIFC